MGAAIEQNLGGGASLESLLGKALQYLEHRYDSKKQSKPEGKSKAGTKTKAEKQPFSITGGANMQPVELQRQAQRTERIRLSKIYKAGRSLGCSTPFLSRLVESEVSLEKAYGAIIDDVGDRNTQGQGLKTLPSLQRHASTSSSDPGGAEAAELSFKQEWSRDRRLQSEFPYFKHYAAFKRHESHIKILGGTVVRGSRVDR